MALLKFSPELADESEPVHIMLKRVELIFLVKDIRTFCSLELREMTMSHTYHESIVEYSRTQTRREQIIRIINKDVIPKLHTSDELPISFKQIELFDNEITDIQMFIRLMIESGYVCCTENDLIMIGLPEKC